MIDIRGIKQNIFIIRQLAKREKLRDNSSTNLGQIWQILDPFINMLILVTLFSTIFKNDSFVNYPLYVCTGTMFYGFFVQGTNGCMDSLVINKQFLVKTTISNNVYVIEKLYVALINLFYSLIIYAGMMAFFSVKFHLINILIIFDIALFSIFILGIGKILAVIYVYFGDIHYLYSIFTLFLFYGTAIFYQPEKLSASLQFFMSLNPIYISIAIARQLLIDGIMPSVHMWIKLAVSAITLYLLGALFFRKGSENVVAKL